MKHPRFQLAFAFFLSLALSAGADWRPGLHCGFHVKGGDDFSAEPIWTGTALDTIAATNWCGWLLNSTAPVVTSGDKSTVWSVNRAWYYWGQIHLPAGEVEFAAGIDDYAELMIDSNVVIKTTICQTGKKTLRFEEAGWHDFSLKVGDVGGGAGPVSNGAGVSKGLGFAIRENGATEWSYPADDGLMTRYRHDDGFGFGKTLQVQTVPDGMPAHLLVPPTDKTGLAPGDTFDCSALPGVLDGIHYRPVGYVMEKMVDGSWLAPVTNLGASTFSYTHGDATRRLTWLYEEDGFQLDAAPLGGGLGHIDLMPSPDLSEKSYRSGTEVTVTAVPDKGYHFAGWDGLPAKEATVRMTMDGPKTLRALFVRGWTYDPAGKTITDGNWVLRVSRDGQELSVTGVDSAQDRAVLDLRPPITGADGVAYKAVAINSQAFKGTTLELLFLPQGFRKIATSAFEGCAALRELPLPDSVTSIEPRAFFGCTSLTTVRLPPGLERLGDSVFSGCRSLVSVTPFLPESLSALGSGAFFGCKKLDGDLVLAHPQLKTIGSTTFQYCESIRSAELPYVETIGRDGFHGCKKLLSIVLSPSLKTIDPYAFYVCGQLETITPFFPGSLESIGKNAFNGCKELTGDLVLSNAAMTALEEGNFSGTAIRSADLPYVESVGSDVLCSSRELGEIRLPSVKTLANAFRSCPALTNVTPFLSDTLTSISGDAFNGSKKLRGTLVLRNPALVKLPSNVFRETAITSAVLPYVTTYSQDALHACRELESVVFSEEPVSLGGYSFYSVRGPLHLYFPRHAPKPSIGNGCLTGGARHLFHGSLRLDPEGWEALTRPLTEADRTAKDFPGEKTFGTLEPGNVRHWLVDWRSPREPKGTILLLR